jgi:thiamine pyrophosphate-dependent acetolactate synthase large subunit-like protein
MGAVDAGKIRYGSDVAVAVLRALELPFVALNPGASFRGLHDSLVNFDDGGRFGDPEIIQCTHEEIAVAVAHGYAKAAGRPMAAALHDVVGLQHASMAVFNAWCDHAPMLLLGGTGPMDTELRRPWIDWVHTALVQGTVVRDIVKWDDQPASHAAVVESLARAHRIMQSEPTGPVYVCLDVGLQEQDIEGTDPDLVWAAEAGRPTIAPAGDPVALRAIATALRTARWPVIVAGSVGRSEAGFTALEELASRWAIPVVDLGNRLNLSSTHPMNLSGADREVVGRADVVLALDVKDLSAPLAPLSGVGAGSTAANAARLFSVSLEDYAISSWIMDYQRLVPVELAVAADSASALAFLLDELGLPGARGDEGPTSGQGPEEGGQGIDARRREVSEWHARLRREFRQQAEAHVGERPIAPAELALGLTEVLDGRDFVLANGDLRGWMGRLLPLRRPRQHLGGSGGAGLGYGIGATIGACLATRGTDTIVLDVQSDGDLMFVPGGLWTLAHHRLPALVVVYNNRSYFNDEEHQYRMADHRGRDRTRAVIGTRIEDPVIDFARLAQSMGVMGLGPVGDGEALRATLAEAVGLVEHERRPVLVDVVTQNR